MSALKAALISDETVGSSLYSAFCPCGGAGAGSGVTGGFGPGPAGDGADFSRLQVTTCPTALVQTTVLLLRKWYTPTLLGAAADEFHLPLAAENVPSPAGWLPAGVTT